MKKVMIFSVALLATGALAHQGADGKVLERMRAMGALGAAMGGVSSELKQETPDFKKLDGFADVFNTAYLIIKDGFPEGSLSEVSEASETIWQDPTGFDAQMKKLENAIMAFDMALENEDIAATQSAFAGLGETCKSCHKDFRVKK